MTDSRIPAPADSDIVLCAPLRTPVGAYGVFSGIPVQDLASTVVNAVVERSGISPEDIDDVILGQVSPAGGAPTLGRVVALDAGLGDSVPGMQLDRRCGSGLQAVATAAAHIACGPADLVIAGGAESMSTTKYAVDGSIRRGVKGGDLVLHDRVVQGRETAGGRNHPILGGMIETAENLREQYSLSREAQDALAARSQQRAAAAQDQGLFDAEIVPVIVPGRRRKDPEITVTADEHPRPGTTASTLAGLRPVRARQDEDAAVTAGNASGQNDGAAALIVTTRARAAELGLTPATRLRGWAVAFRL